MLNGSRKAVVFWVPLLVIVLAVLFVTNRQTSAGDDTLVFLPMVAKPLRYWMRTYSGAPNEAWASLNAVELTSDGGYIVAGEVDRLSPLHSGAWLLKLNADGKVNWQRTIPEGSEAFYAMETSDGGFVLVGQSYALGAGERDAWIIKLDSAGEILWQKSYGGSDQEWLAGTVVETGDGELFLAGTTDSFGAGGKDIWVLKLQEDGSPLWAKSYGSLSFEEANTFAATVDGGLILAGNKLIVRIDKAGAVLWAKRNFEASFYAIRQSRDGGFIAAGWDGTTIKMDGQGDAIWAKSVLFGDNFSILDIWEDAVGDLYLAGDAHSNGYKAILLKMDRDGKVLWFHTYGGNDANHFRSLRQEANGDLVAAGITMSYNPEGKPPEAWLVKMNSNGEMGGCDDMESVDPAVVKLDFTIIPSDLTVMNASGSLQSTAVASYEENTAVKVVCPAVSGSAVAHCP